MSFGAEHEVNELVSLDKNAGAGTIKVSNQDIVIEKIDGTITHIRTLRFNAAAENLQLEIKRMKYEKVYDEYVNIPID